MAPRARMGKGAGYMAVDRYIREKGQAGCVEIYECAKLGNGKSLRNSQYSLSVQRIGQYMRRSGKFEIAEKRTNGPNGQVKTSTQWRHKQ